MRRGAVSDSPSTFVWRYDRAEVIADAIIHALGVVLALAGAVALFIIARDATEGREFVAVAVYALALLTALALSAAYNLWPVTPVKWLLRRLDHSAIYVLIAGTYTPFLTQLKGGFAATGLFVGVWVTAAVGIAMKLLLPGRFDRVAVGVYLALGWSGAFAYDAVADVLPGAALWLLAVGGGLYSLGVVFHAWRRLRFQNAIWHAFVLLGAACHYGAVLAGVVRVP
jgi:hemolysin III